MMSLLRKLRNRERRLGLFDKVVNFRDRNYGCKFNIINGITEVFKDLNLNCIGR